MPAASTTPVKVYYARDVMQAHALRNLLAEEGIHARVSSASALELGFACESLSAEILVPHEDVVRARQILRSWEQQAKTSSMLRTRGSFQFGLLAAVVNSIVLTLLFSIAMVMGNDGNMIVGMLTMVVLGNLAYMARYRQRRQRFANHGPDA